MSHSSIPEPSNDEVGTAEMLEALQISISTVRRSYDSMQDFHDKGTFIKFFLNGIAIVDSLNDKGEQERMIDTAMVGFIELHSKSLIEHGRWVNKAKSVGDAEQLQSPPPEYSAKAIVHPQGVSPIIDEAFAVSGDNAPQLATLDSKDQSHADDMDIEEPETVSHGTATSSVSAGQRESESIVEDSKDSSYVDAGDQYETDGDAQHESDDGDKNDADIDDLSIVRSLRGPNFKNQLQKVLCRKFAKTHGLFHHKSDGDNAQFDVLIGIIQECCVEELKWNSRAITPLQVDLLDLVASFLSDDALFDILQVAKDVLEQQHTKDHGSEQFNDDKVLSDANQSFARALRHLETLVASDRISNRAKHLFFNLAHAELLMSYRAAIKEIQQHVGKGKKFKSVRDWVSANLTKAGLQDEYSLMPKGKKVNLIDAIRIVQFYQRNRGRKFPEDDYAKWSDKLNTDLLQAKKIEAVCKFEKGLYGLLPHHARRLQNLAIEQDIEVDGHTGAKKSINIISQILLAIQAKFPVRQLLRALWKGLLLKLVDKEQVIVQDYNSLCQLIASRNWQGVDPDLYDGASIGMVEPSGETVA